MKKAVSITLILISIMTPFNFKNAPKEKQEIVVETVSYEAPVTPVVPVPETEPIVNEEIIEEKEEIWKEFVATAYCPCEICCGIYAKNRPNGIVYTASGEVAIEGITIAADWEVLSPGTEVEIKDIGNRIVHDRGGAIKGNRIDIYYESHQEALNFGVQEVLILVKE